MKTNDFNTEARTPRYGYTPSPVNPRAFMIMKHMDSGHAGARTVGDYTVLDSNEDLRISEKKVMNLVSLLNGRQNLIQVGTDSGSRILYHLVSECDDDGKSRVLFYKLGKEGVSVENALFRMEAEHAV